MRATQRPKWIGSLAKLPTCLIVLLTAGCTGAPSQSSSSLPTPAPRSDIGIVSGVLGLELSPAPAGPAASTATSDLALIVSTQQAGGATWRRLVIADGTSGWTSRPFETVRAVRVRPATRPFSLLSKSPDDPSFSDAEEIHVAGEVDGQIVGVSERARVAGNEQLMLPERYRRSLPWLKLKFGSVQGFAPVDWVALLPTPTPVTGPLAEALDALEARGLVWRPFLGGLPSVPVAPETVFELEDPTSAPVMARSSREWNALEFSFRDDRGLMAVYADGPQRLFRLSREKDVPVDIVLKGDFATPAKVQHTDVNADGAQDWLVEIAARYGDGYYAVLWIIDGRTARGPLRLERLLLSRSTAESASPGVDARWDVLDNGTIQVTRGTADKKQTTVYRYSDRLTEVH